MGYRRKVDTDIDSKDIAIDELLELIFEYYINNDIDDFSYQFNNFKMYILFDEYYDEMNVSFKLPNGEVINRNDLIPDSNVTFFNIFFPISELDIEREYIKNNTSIEELQQVVLTLL